MDSYAFIAAKATLVFLAAVLIVEYVIRRRNLSRESEQNRQKQQQLAAYHSDLKNLKAELARKSEIAEKLPQITKKLTEKLPADAYPAIAVRSIMDFFHAKKVGYFAPVEGSSDYSLVIGTGFPPDWIDKVRIHSQRGDPGHGAPEQGRRIEDGPALLFRPEILPLFPRRHGRGARFRRARVRDLRHRRSARGRGLPLPPRRGENLRFDVRGSVVHHAPERRAPRFEPERQWVDHLTGMANRLYFQQRFESEIRRTGNYRQALALFMFDIDEFKRINDTHGHHAGDVVIKKLAEIVKKNTRGGDLVGRYGGDEFIVLITSTTEKQAISFAEKLREMISATDIAIPGTEVPVRITVSGGLAMFPTHGQSTTELFRAADDALFESKRQGRNRILIAASVGLDGGIAKGTDADREPPESTDISADTGSDAVEYPLGELGEDLKT